MHAYPLARPATIVAAAACFSFAQAQHGAAVTPAASAAQASDVSQQLSPSFAGMGIEPSNMFSFTGGETPNELSINLLQNLANYSGAPPHIRMGGNTGDYMIYNASYMDFKLQDNPAAIDNGGESGNAFIFGPNYLAALDRFPTGTPITYGLNMGYQGEDYADSIAAEAAGVLDELNNTKVVSFEIGNEPDLYLQTWNLLRSGTWDGPAYTKDFLSRAGIVYDRVLKPRGMSATFFETAQTASTISNTFQINDLVDAGIADSVSGSKFISSWNQHDYFYFVGVSSVSLVLKDLMNIDNTESQFKFWTTEVSAALKTGLPYNLREMASVGPTGLKGISDTFGAALWTLNFFCYAATLNISSVQMHMTDNSFAAPWQPTHMNNVGPNIRPSYYAYAAFAQLLGSGNGTTQLSPLLLDTTNSFVRAYTAYANGDLSAIILINANQANASTTTKANFTITVSLPDFAGQTLYLSYLTADGADSTSNATWNNISFDQEDSVGTPSGGNTADAPTVTIDSNGAATIPVRDSQAIIAKLDSALGAETVSKSPSATSSGSSAIPVSTSSDAADSASSTTGAAASSTTTGGTSAGARTSSPGGFSSTAFLMVILTLGSSLVLGSSLI